MLVAECKRKLKLIARQIYNGVKMSGIKIGHGNPNIQTDVACMISTLTCIKEKYFVLFLNKVCV